MRDEVALTCLIPDKTLTYLDRLPCALRVAELIRTPGLFEHWRKRCHESFRERQERRKKLDAWKQQRASHMLQQHSEQAILNCENEGNPCQVPPELESDKEPYGDGPLPILSLHPLSLSDCYFILALVHDDKRRDACRINRFGPDEIENLTFPSDEWREWSFWRSQSERVSGLRSEHQMTLDDCLARVESDLSEIGLRGGDICLKPQEPKDQEQVIGTEFGPLPMFMSAPDLAQKLGADPKKVDLVLRRIAKGNEDARIPVNAPKKGDPRYLYRTEIVWEPLFDWNKTQKTIDRRS